MEDLSKLTKQELIERLQNQQVDELDTELQKVANLATATNPYSIPVHETGTKGITLWTPLNKRIGPLHPTNAESTMKRWRKAGYPLYTTKRTEQQIEDFKKTDFYKKEHAKHLELRKQRHSKSSKGQINKMLKEIGKGVATELRKENA